MLPAEREMWWSTVAAWAGEEPVGELTWNPRETVISVVAPTGEELSEEGPARLALRIGPDALVWSGTGGRLARGIAVRADAGDDVRVEGTLTTCNPETGVCRPLDVHWRGVRPGTRRGAITLVAEAPGSGEASPFRADAAAAAEVAFARARREDRPVLLDFGAVWCPPCNLLTAEVLHSSSPDPALDAVVVVALDVDDPSSWALKDRYSVGGYPTVVVARPDGEELGRLVGYPGRDAWLQWLGEVAVRAAPVVDPNVRDPEATPPEEAARIARALVDAGRAADAGRWLSRAADGEDLRVARFVVDATASDAVWLADHGVPPAAWVAAAIGEPNDPAIAAAARRAIDAALPVARGAEAADLLAYRAELGAPEEKAVLYAAAAVALRTALTGDAALDRGYYTFLAELQAEAGDLDGAVSFLDSQSVAFPDEPTFDLAAARLLNHAGRHADAASRAERALGRSWGDNHLRVAAQLAEAKAGLGDASAAAAVAADALAAVPAPPAEIDVRTPRYRAALEKYLVVR